MSRRPHLDEWSVRQGDAGSGAPAHGWLDSGEFTVRMFISEDADVAVARQHVRQLAPHGSLSVTAAHALLTAVSEIVHNVLIHARHGELRVRVANTNGRRGLIAVVRDVGPGIADIDRAMADGYSTANGLGLGLSGARRLVDDFELVSIVGHGTTVTLKKWGS